MAGSRGLNSAALILLIGLPGAGKSTLARALARRRGDARVDRDAVRARMFRGLPVTYLQKQAANAAVWREAARLLGTGRSVIVDGMTFASAADRRRGHAMARRLRARCLEIYLECPAALAAARVRRGGAHPATDRSPALVAEVARRFEPVGPGALRLDARRPAGALLRAALSWLARAPGRAPARPRERSRPRAAVRGAAR